MRVGEDGEEHHLPSISDPNIKKIAKVRPNPRAQSSDVLVTVDRDRPNPTNGNTSVEPRKQSIAPIIAGIIFTTTTSPIFFESGVNTECIQLLRQLWNVHEEAVDFLHQVSAILRQCQRRVRLLNPTDDDVKHSHASTESSINKGNSSKTPQTELGTSTCEAFPFLEPLISGLKCISENVSDLEKQFLTVSVYQPQCKLVLFAKICHARQYVTHDRLAILHTVNQLIIASLQLLSSTIFWISDSKESLKSYLFSVFRLTEIYNICLESTWTTNDSSNIISASGRNSTTSATTTTTQEIPTKTKSKVLILTQVQAANRNDSPSVRLSLKPLSAIKLLHIFFQKRAPIISYTFTRIIQTNFILKSNQSGGGGSDSGGLNKSRPSVTSISLDKFESCFIGEDSKLRSFEYEFSKCPSLLGKSAVKKCENGEHRLTRSVRAKMYTYCRQILWSLVGEISEDLLLWSFDSSIPLALYPLDTFIALRNSLALGRHIADSNGSPLTSAFDAISSSLHSFTLLVSWDEKIRNCFEIAMRVKRPEQMLLNRNPRENEWATEIGEKFGDIVATCISLIEGSGGDMIGRIQQQNQHVPSTSSSSGGNNNVKIMKLYLQTEEEPLSDEAQTLFRLEATLDYFKGWIVKRTKMWLNAWAIPQFLACSQRDSALLAQLVKSRESVFITREILLTSENTSIRLSARQRQMCADDLYEALVQLQKLPNELIQVVHPVCKTLSLATLQSNMPIANHWRGIGPSCGLSPDKPSPYVQVFLQRVIEPAMTASVEFVSSSVQESMGKQVIQAACEAWLQYILQKKIRFSEWGAVQLLRDFMSLRDWIRNETQLEDEARKSILQLEILKRCEGVAYLLLRSPGDVLGVGKPSRKTRRVAPSSSSVESSPSMSENSIAEDDIPPEMYVPNQQMWLDLRIRRNGLSSCC